jgi:hypothetical protein
VKIRIRLWDVGMDGNPGASEDSHDAAPYDAPNRSTVAKIVTRRRCALLDGWNGKPRDAAQEVESDKKDQHDYAENAATGNVFLYFTL